MIIYHFQVRAFFAKGSHSGGVTRFALDFASDHGSIHDDFADMYICMFRLMRKGLCLMFLDL